MAQITVGIPFFDEARHLGAAIRSVLGQTFQDFELLLVDDGSRDDSLAIARSFHDSRITVVSDGERRHLPARLNEIVRRARTPLVARIDADDVMHPTRLEAEMAVMSADSGCDVVGTWAVLVDGQERPFGAVETGPIPPTPRSALLHGVFPHATVLGRRAWFMANPYDEALTRAEDRDLWCRTVTTSRFAVVPRCLYVIRVDVAKQSFLRGYLDGLRQNRALFAKYGPAAVGRFEATRLRLAAHAKAAVMVSVSRAGLSERLVRRRGRTPTTAEIALAREALAAARG